MRIPLLLLASAIITAGFFMMFGVPKNWTDGIPWFCWGWIIALLVVALAPKCYVNRKDVP